MSTLNDIEEYVCPQCGRTHTKMYRGKPSKIFEDHLKYYLPNVDVKERVKIEENISNISNISSVNDPRINIIVETMTVSRLEKILLNLSDRELNHIVRDVRVINEHGEAAIWRLDGYECGNNKIRCFTPLESEIFAPLIAMAKNKKFGFFAKQKWKKKVIKNGQ